jgi:hypothetical protein
MIFVEDVRHAALCIDAAVHILPVRLQTVNFLPHESTRRPVAARSTAQITSVSLRRSA